MVADTNIILFCNKGDKQAFSLIQDNNIYVSAITEIELLGYKGISTKERKILRNFLDDFTVIAVNDPIKEMAIDLRVKYGLKTPDSIIAATAQYLGLPLVSADKQLRQVKEINLLYYNPVK